MTLSVDQRRILAAMAQGHKLLALPSPIDGRVVGANLWDPRTNTVESIALWRVERLVRLGQLHGSPATAGAPAEWTVEIPARTMRNAGRRHLGTPRRSGAAGKQADATDPGPTPVMASRA